MYNWYDGYKAKKLDITEEFYLNGTEVTATAEELNSVSAAITVANKTGGDLNAGTLVYLSGYDTTLDAPTVTKASLTVQATHVLTEDIDDDESGVADEEALVENLDTSTASAVGALVYLAADGAFSFTAPTGADEISQIVGVVVTKHASTGSIKFFPGYPAIRKIGTSSLQDDAVTTDKIVDNAVTNDKLANIARGSIKIGGASDALIDLDAKTNAQILIGDGTDLKSVAVSGDVTIDNTGAVTIANNAVEEVMIFDGAVTENKLGTASVTEIKINDKAVTAAKTSGVAVLYNLGAPGLASADAVVVSEAAAEDKNYTLTGSPYTPDIPRNITITRTVVDAEDTIGDITVSGTNYNDEVITEEFVVGGNGVTVLGNKAFKTVTSVVGSTYTQGGAGSDTIEVGIGNKIGCAVGTNVAANIMLGILGVTIIDHNPAVGGTVAVETTTVDMSAGTYDGAKSVLVFQKN